MSALGLAAAVPGGPAGSLATEIPPHEAPRVEAAPLRAGHSGDGGANPPGIVTIHVRIDPKTVGRLQEIARLTDETNGDAIISSALDLAADVAKATKSGCAVYIQDKHGRRQSISFS